METWLERLKLRFSADEAVPEDGLLSELLQTVSDRISIRLETEELPEVAGSVVVDATMKAVRLLGFEGSRSESSADGGSFSTSFIDDVLDAYRDDLAALKRQVNKSGIRFL